LKGKNKEICERCCQKQENVNEKCCVGNGPGRTRKLFVIAFSIADVSGNCDLPGKLKFNSFSAATHEKLPSHFLEEKCTSFASSKFKFSEFFTERKSFLETPNIYART
jgi:hypothetical protein